MVWQALIDEASLAAWLPAANAPMARPIKAALVAFLGQLPPAQQDAILLEQADLPPSSSLAVRMGAVARQCPVLHKLGQLLARDQRLAEELRCELRPLESLPPSMDLETARTSLTQELGSLEQRGIVLQAPVLAEASVAVVIPFRDLRSPERGAGVLKVLKPGIEERLEHELNSLAQVGLLLDEQCAELDIPPLDYHETFAQVAEKLRCETRLDQEQRNLQEAARFYASEADVVIPTVWLDHCTARVTAMERIPGAQVTDVAAQRPTEARRLATTVSRQLLARPMFCSQTRALFHADPHAGNLLSLPDGRLGVLDWSLVGHLRDQERIAMGQVLIGAVTLNAARIVDELMGLDTQRRATVDALQPVVARSLRQLCLGHPLGLNWLVRLLDEATHAARLRLNADMIMFRKSLHTLEGVAQALGTDPTSLDGTVLREFLRCFAVEWPARWLAWPTSRDFATRLSNLDIATTLASLPWVAWAGIGVP